MKKFLLIVTVLFVTTNFVFANDDKFVNALRNCSLTYKETDTVNVNGVKALSSKSMSGWKNGKCTYIEKVTINSRDFTTKCSFTKSQVSEIVSVADAYYTTMKYSGENPDTSSLDAVKNNPLYNVMNKYLQDSSVCSIGGLE